MLIPKWVDTNHTSNLSTSNFKSNNQITTTNFNIPLSKIGRLTS